MLIDFMSNVEMTDDESNSGISLLQMAVETDNVETARVILDCKGEEADSTGVWGTSALAIAAWNSSVNCVKLLLENGGKRVWKRVCDMVVCCMHCHFYYTY
jgi:ankyrin repeat protein